MEIQGDKELVNEGPDILIAPDVMSSSAAAEYCADHSHRKIAKRGKPAEEAVWCLMALRLNQDISAKQSTNTSCEVTNPLPSA